MKRWRTTDDGPVVTYALIGLCCLAFLVSPLSGFNPVYGRGDALLAAQSAYFERWGVIPSQLMTGSPHALLTPLTALFVHGNWLHLLGNMLFLYVFGAMAEERMGRLRFAVFYLVIGYLALTAYAIANASSQETLVGASGAIAGVLGAFLYLFPKARVTSLFPFLFFLPLRFPAWIVLVFWFALQYVAQQQTPPDGPAVAYLAHLVGFGGGFLYAWVRYWRTDRVRAQTGATEGERQP
ncbi:MULTISPECIES: rhomboid family intramembrane serine protease [unclassified Streptomyces]|uniref:rhomboid family intramembrane serine protease n=1 Tax=unclassified Streptomyces TaxID=2593676 RepID=UPI001F51FF05|nr:rhomboid family intramembrane serine protease [Streptomyces sp. NBC_00370]